MDKRRKFPIERDHHIVRILRRNYPHHVILDPYELKPRPEKVRGCSSWVERRGTRTFGFKEESQALDFMDQHGGKYTKYKEQPDV